MAAWAAGLAAAVAVVAVDPLAATVVPKGAVVEAAMEAAQAAVRAAQAGWAAASEDLVEAAVVAASTAAGQAMAAEQVAARARGGWAQEAPLARKLACCALRPCVHGCAVLPCSVAVRRALSWRAGRREVRVIHGLSVLFSCLLIKSYPVYITPVSPPDPREFCTRG